MENLSDECNEWKADGFKCVEADMCEDGHFDNSGGVPAIREELDKFVDIDKVNEYNAHHYSVSQNIT